jgi:protein-S-isoprenylcysteine O-methyltransferase Ste14
MTHLVFCIVAGSAMLAIAGVLLSWGRPAIRIWPPPRARSWQAYLSWLFIGFTLAGPFVLGLLDWNAWSVPTWMRVLAGLGLTPAGFAMTFAAMRRLTVTASFGLQGRLVTSGPYRYSRNPQCVGLIAGYVGFALFCNSLLALVAAVLVGIMLGLSPFAEEPWLNERFGADYADYARRVPRFLGIPKVARTPR